MVQFLITIGLWILENIIKFKWLPTLWRKLRNKPLIDNLQAEKKRLTKELEVAKLGTSKTDIEKSYSYRGKSYKSGIILLEAIRSARLVDIENREHIIREVPPSKFYELASKQILILAITASNTFNKHIDVVRKLLKDGKHIYVLILDPDCDAARELSDIENKDIPGEIRGTLDIIKREGFIKRYPCSFHIRFLSYRPPYTAIMLDGDVAPDGTDPLDEDAQLRIQPATKYDSQHFGFILQFINKNQSPFKRFAEDLRKQWPTR